MVITNYSHGNSMCNLLYFSPYIRYPCLGGDNGDIQINLSAISLKHGENIE